MENKIEQIKTTIQKPQFISYGRATENITAAINEYIEKKLREVGEALENINQDPTLAVINSNFEELFLTDENFYVPQQDISSLKKRIKHCKNHMEKQRLQRELNALYKEQKRRK